jgi:hypothetical protein
LITDLVRRVRRRLDALAREVQRPLYLFVRVPPSSADCATAGLEVEIWIRERLVDLVSPAQIMTLAWDMPIADLVALGREHGVAVQPSLYPRNSWRLPFPTHAGAGRYDGAKVARDATPEEIRGAAAVYRGLGVDGFYLFNFYNAFGSSRPHDDLVYRVLRDLARPENLAGQSKVFAVTKSYYHDGPGSYAYGKQLPAKPGRDGALALSLPVYEQPGAGPFPLKTCELRVGLRGLPTAARVSVSWNGRALAEGVRFTTREITRAAPRQPDAAEDYLHWPVPDPGLVRAGANTVRVTIAGMGAATTVTDVELRYDYENRYERLWQREPVKLNEAPATRK